MIRSSWIIVEGRVWPEGGRAPRLAGNGPELTAVRLEIQQRTMTSARLEIRRRIAEKHK